MATSGNVYGLVDSTVYLKKHATLTPFVWGGRCMRLEEGTENLGGLAVTTRQDPRGGIERDGVRMEAPGDTTTTLAMKRIQRDTMKTELRRCLYDLDQRFHCSGIDRDSPFKWEEITRYCLSKMTDRGLTGSGWEGDEEAMVTFSVTALSVEDIYRVSGSLGEPAHDDLSLAVTITDVTVCQPERCPDHCDEQEECVVVAVTEDDAGTGWPHLLINLYGGDLDMWTQQPLTTFGAQDASAVICLGEFVVAVSAGDTSIIYSDDRGVTQVNIDQATYTDWGTHAPVALDAIDQTFIVMVGADGYVYGSFDAARTWETLSDGTATTGNLIGVKIARDNPHVIYAIDATTGVIKSENSGETWFAATAHGGGNALSLRVIDQSTVLIGTDAGEIFQTVDGAVTWVEQGDLPGLTTKADNNIEAITGCGCGILYLVASDTTANEQKVFRNVDGGASGRWFEPEDYEDPGASNVMTAVACCGPNHVIVTGGQAAATDAILLLM